MKRRYRCLKEDQWISAVILGRAGKVTGSNCNWYNVKESNGEKKSVDFQRVQWERVDGEESYVTFIPRTQDSPECISAKQIELEKLKTFGTYEEVADRGQTRISTRWIVWHKGKEVRARLVARGFEEDSNIQRDSPTVGKSAVRMLLAIAASKNWKVKTTDIKSAFLQGKQLDRRFSDSTSRGKYGTRKNVAFTEVFIWAQRCC